MLRSVLALTLLALTTLFALPSSAAAFCSRAIERTPVAFSRGGDELLVEVLERDSCFPDGVAAQRLEVIRLGDLAVVEEIELVRGERDWSDAETWEAQNAQEIEASIHARRTRALHRLAARFPDDAVRRDARWYDDVLVDEAGRRLRPAGSLPAADPYASEPPPVQVFVAARARVAVGLIRDHNELRLVALQAAPLV